MTISTNDTVKPISAFESPQEYVALILLSSHFSPKVSFEEENIYCFSLKVREFFG
jgi:hypothetical protein